MAAILVIILVIVLAMVLLRRARCYFAASCDPAGVFGAAEARKGARAREASSHVVVDALNLTHWARPGEQTRPLVTCDVVRAIDDAAPLLREKYSGRIMFVTKDRESELNDARVRALYAAAARRNKVYVYVVERYDPAAAPRGPPALGRHTERGRDDFLIGVLADRHRCPVLSHDRFRDFNELRAAVGPFQAREYSPYREFPDVQQFNPTAPKFAGVRRPHRIGYRTALKKLALPGRE